MADAQIVLADDKKADLLEGGRPYLDTLELRLYVTPLTLSGTVQPSSPSDDCPDSGHVVAAGRYPTSATLVGGLAHAVGDIVTFVFAHNAGDFTVEGVYFTDPGDGDATVFAAADPSPFTCTAPGQVYVVRCFFDFDTL